MACPFLKQSLTFNYGIKNCKNSELSTVLYDQLVHLIDIILDGRKCHLESLRGTPKENVLLKQYGVDRHKLISPFCKYLSVKNELLLT